MAWRAMSYMMPARNWHVQRHGFECFSVVVVVSSHICVFVPAVVLPSVAAHVSNTSLAQPMAAQGDSTHIHAVIFVARRILAKSGSARGGLTGTGLRTTTDTDAAAGPTDWRIHIQTHPFHWCRHPIPCWAPARPIQARGATPASPELWPPFFVCAWGCPAQPLIMFRILARLQRLRWRRSGGAERPMCRRGLWRRLCARRGSGRPATHSTEVCLAAAARRAARSHEPEHMHGPAFLGMAGRPNADKRPPVHPRRSGRRQRRLAYSSPTHLSNNNVPKSRLPNHPPAR